MTDDSWRIDWKNFRIHFVAIGGIGMSALARIAAAKGAVVSGCDSSDSRMLAELRSSGCECFVGHSPGHLDAVDLVVYSSAVPPDNPELAAAASRGIEVISRGRMLARLTEGHDTVAVSGAHGKTSSTWLVANMLIRCGVDPSVAVGGIVSDLGGNWRVGEGSIFVTEADESDGSFLYLAPRYPVITNIDADHLDHYSGLDEIKQAFARFAEATGDGAVIACADCPNVRDILHGVGGRIITFGTEGGDVHAENIRLEPDRAVYDARLPAGMERDIVLSMPGIHNVRNSLAALALAVELDLTIDGVRDAFANASLVGRRLERRGSARGVAVYDDYAHHPAEIRATLEAARMLSQGRLVGIFQPHRYTRTLHLHREFGPVFDRLDLLLLAPIYAASEPPIEGVTSELLAREIKELGTVRCELVPDLARLPERLARELAPGDMLITLGAGDVWQVGDSVLRLLTAQADAA